MKLPGLKEARELHGWSQAKLAEEAGVSRDSISNYETGQREAWPATAKRLADALGVEIEELVHPKAERRSSPEQAAAAAPRANKERLEEYFDNVSEAEISYLNETLADFWRLALPGEKPIAHFVPEDIDTDRVWGFLNKVLTRPNMFTPEATPEELERFNQGYRKKVLA